MKYSIPVDLLNPGQVLACLGFMEAALHLGLEVEPQFNPCIGSHTEFSLHTASVQDPFSKVLDFVMESQVQAECPDRSEDIEKQWRVPMVPGEAISRQTLVPLQASVATLTAWLTDSQGHRVPVYHWGDGTTRENFKLWAGMAGKPGATLLKEIRAEVAGLDRAASRATPFDMQLPLSSSFRLDPRGSYIPLDAGFSLNPHSHMIMQGFPLVELFAAIGLSEARPARISRRDKLHLRYGVPMSDAPLPPAFARAAMSGAALPIPTRTFNTTLDWPGKSGQARAIVSTLEEIRP